MFIINSGPSNFYLTKTNRRDKLGAQYILWLRLYVYTIVISAAEDSNRKGTNGTNENELQISYKTTNDNAIIQCTQHYVAANFS